MTMFLVAERGKIHINDPTNDHPTANAMWENPYWSLQEKRVVPLMYRTSNMVSSHMETTPVPLRTGIHDTASAFPPNVRTVPGIALSHSALAGLRTIV
jgi:hypothetical protein